MLFDETLSNKYLCQLIIHVSMTRLRVGQRASEISFLVVSITMFLEEINI